MIECCGIDQTGDYCLGCQRRLTAREDTPFNRIMEELVNRDLSDRRAGPHPEAGPPEPGQPGYNIYPEDRHGDTSIDSQDWDRNAYYKDGKRYITGTGGP